MQEIDVPLLATPASEWRQDAPMRDVPFMSFAQMEPIFRDIHYKQLYGGGAHIRAAWICLNKMAPSRRSKWRTWWRRMRGIVAGSFTHAELMLQDSAGNTYAYTVDQLDPAVVGSGFVRMYTVDTARAYPAQYWSCFRIEGMSAAQLHGLSYYCARQQGKPMDSWGLYYNFLPLFDMFVGRPRDEEDRYFCSQLVAAALCYVDPVRFRRVNPRLCTPENLLRLLAEHDRMFVQNNIIVAPSAASSSASSTAASSPIERHLASAARLDTVCDQTFRPFDPLKLI